MFSACERHPHGHGGVRERFQRDPSELVWLIGHAPSGPVRSRLERMLAPFQALLERYPTPAGAPAAEEDTPAAPPVAATSPA